MNEDRSLGKWWCRGSLPKHVCVRDLIWKNYIFVDIVKYLERRSFWIIQVTTKYNDKCLYMKQKEEERYIEDNVITVAETGVVEP